MLMLLRLIILEHEFVSFYFSYIWIQIFETNVAEQLNKICSRVACRKSAIIFVNDQGKLALLWKKK